MINIELCFNLEAGELGMLFSGDFPLWSCSMQAAFYEKQEVHDPEKFCGTYESVVHDKLHELLIHEHEMPRVTLQQILLAGFSCLF